MKRTKKKNGTLILLILVLCISIGYAAVTTVLKIGGSIGLGVASFDVHFSDVSVRDHTADEQDEGGARIKSGTADKEIEFSISMDELGENYMFTANIVNNSGTPQKVKNVVFNGLSESQQKIIEYKVYYTSTGVEVAADDYLLTDEEKNITVYIEYKLSPEATEDDLPTGSDTINCTFTINFENTTAEAIRQNMASTLLVAGLGYEPMSSNTLSFENPASADEFNGVYVLASTAEDILPVYFYRGNDSVNNNVVVNDDCWRIIRTTSAGGIKLIYNGEAVDGDHGKQCSGTGSIDIGTHIYSASDNDTYNLSELAVFVEGWYYSNGYNTLNEYMEDENYCDSASNDRFNPNENLLCYYTEYINMANERATYPVALPNQEEMILAGVGDGDSSYSWIIQEQHGDIWMMTRGNRPEEYDGENDRFALTIGENKTFVSDGVGESHYVRPVITLNYKSRFTGTGTTTDPYVLVTE